MLTITRKCLIHINKLGIRPFLSIDRHKIAKIEDYSKTHLRVGDFIEVEWAFKQNEISNFLSVIGDENPIHYDENYVKKYTKFSRVIVPGMMAGFLFTKIISEYLPTPIHIQQELKFCQPIFEGEEIKAKLQLIQIQKLQKYFHFRTIIKGLEDLEEPCKRRIKVDGQNIIWLPTSVMRLYDQLQRLAKKIVY